jgi:hypothetical protein
VKDRVASILNQSPPAVAVTGLLASHGATVPADGTRGYETGCIFAHTDGGVGTAFYVNEGSVTSSAFAAVAGLTAAQEALLGATAGTSEASKALIPDSNGELTAGPIILADLATVPGVGITGSADNVAYGVEKFGSLFRTTIVVDIDGLNSGGTIGDIIGADGAGAAHLGQITAARNGTIFAGELTCLELPTGGDPDINLYSATEATGVEDTAIATLTETLLLNSGDLVAGNMLPLTAFPAADEYLYLACGAVTDATYTAGIIKIVLWGK